jgi:hypothetical protein
VKRIVQGKEERAASEKALQGDRPAEKGGKLSAWAEQQPRGSSLVDRSASKGGKLSAMTEQQPGGHGGQSSRESFMSGQNQEW